MHKIIKKIIEFFAIECFCNKCEETRYQEWQDAKDLHFLQKYGSKN